MGIEDLKWWHWVVISLLIGYLLAYANSAPPEPVGLIEQQVIQFERDTLHAPVGAAQTPWVKNLIVYPVVKKAALGRPAQIVLYDVLAHRQGDPANQYVYQKCWFCAAVPYIPTNQRLTLNAADAKYIAEAQKAANSEALPPGVEQMYVPKPEETLESITATVYGTYTGAGQEAIATANQPFRYGHSIQKLIDLRRWTPGRKMFIPWNPAGQKTVADWLDGSAKNYSWVRYTYAWWKVPRYCNLLWIGSTFAVVGLLWPAMLSVMSGAGLGRPRAAKDDYNLGRFGTSKAKSRMPAKSTEEMTEAHQQQLTSLNEALTESVKDSLTPGSQQINPPGEPAGAQTSARQFSTAQIAAPAGPVGEKPKESKDFTGEFYPVARPVVKEEQTPTKPSDPPKSA